MQSIFKNIFIIYRLIIKIAIACAFLITTVFAVNLSHFHTPQYDTSGKLIPWHIDAAGPFDHIIDIEAKWWQKCPNVNGWPAFITASELRRDYSQANGATIGTTCSFGILAYLKFYAYTGNPAYLQMCKLMGDFILQRDLTPSTYSAYPQFPWPVGETGSIMPDGSGHGDCLAGEIMPDKGAMLGVALVQLYKATNDSSYLKEAVQIADVLANNAVIGTAVRSPWPFRARASNGNLVDGDISGNQTFALRLFDELIRLNIAGNGKYQATRANVWNWIKTVAIADTTGSKWQDFFEDHGGNEDNPTQICALETARYLLEKKDALDAQWSTMIASIIATVKAKWVVHSGSYTSIGEQQQDMTAYNSHTARYASILAMYYEAGGPAAYKDEAYSSFAYSTYSVDSLGFADTYYGDDIAWTTDSYGDWMQHFMDGLGAVAEWAPDNASHLLRTTSTIQNIAYAIDGVDYTAFDKIGSEKLKLNFTPAFVKVNNQAISTYTWNQNTKVLIVDRTTGGRVAIMHSTIASSHFFPKIRQSIRENKDSKGRIRILLPSDFPVLTEASVFDINGKKNGFFKSISGSTQEIIIDNLDAKGGRLSPGYYIVRLAGPAGIVNLPLVVEK